LKDKFSYAISILFFLVSLNLKSQEKIPVQIQECNNKNYDCDCFTLNLKQGKSFDVLAYANYYYANNCALTIAEKKDYYKRARANWDEIGYRGFRYLNTYFYVIADQYDNHFNTDSLNLYIGESMSLPIINDPDYLGSYVNILRYKAWQSRAIGDTQLSMQIYEDFIESPYFETITQYERAWLYYNYADLLIDIPNFKLHEKSKQLHIKSLQILEKSSINTFDRERLFSSNKFGLGRYYEKKDSLDKALDHYLVYNDFWEKYKHFPNMGTSLNSIGDVYLKKGRESEGLKMYQKSIEFSNKDSSINEFEHSPYISLSKIYQKWNSLDSSLHIIDDAISLLYNSEFDHTNLLEIENKQIKYPLAHLEILNEIGNTMSLYDNETIHDLALNYFQKAFNYFHSQFDNVTYNKSKYQKKKDFDYLFQNLVSLTIKMGDMKQVFQILDQGKHSILGYEMQKKADAFNIKSDIDDNYFSPNQSIIQFGSTTDSIIAVVKHKDSYKYYNLGEVSYVHNLILEYIQLLRDVDNRHSENFYSLSNTLYKVLFEPLNVSTEEIKIIPTEFLALLPFESLVMNVNDRESFILKEHRLAYSLSIKLDQILNSRFNEVSGVSTFTPIFDTNPNGNIAIERGSNISISGLFDLIHSKTETASIQQIMSAEDKDVNKQTLFNAMEDDQVLHFSGHAVNYFNDAELSFLAFNSKIENEENKLTLPEISNATCNNQMVVLSACDTGTGEVIVGEGVLSLARGFFQAGAKSVISTLWSVNDQSSSMIIKEFYAKLNEGEYKDQALRNAKLNYINYVKNEELKHPYYWAGFVAAGNMDPIRNNYNLYFIGFACLSLVLFGFLFYQSKVNVR